MPESSNNNTNELSAGSGVGLNGFSNYTSRALDIARSRGNYQTAIKDDKQLQAFREIVYKMVSTWLYEDKIRIVAEYGDSEYLSKNPKEKDLNAVCTESLIIHLPKSDLQKLVADTRLKENQLRKEVKEATKNRDAAATAVISSSFTYNSPMDYAKTTDPNKIEEIIRTADQGFKIPKDIKRQFSGLAKELKEVLNECYSGTMLAALGHRMGLKINIDDDELKESIINKTILYVALVTGVSKSTAMQNAFVNPDPYNELLHFTTYSYLTGEPGMDMNTWKKLRDSARTAKKQAEIFAKMRKDRARTGSAAYKALSGGIRSARKIGENDIGILKNATMDELITLAGKYGIETKNKDIGKVKKELYRAMAANSQAIEKANTRIAFAQDRGKMPNQSDMDIVSIRGAGVYSKGLRDAVDESGDRPIVRFSQNGIRLTERIMRAVPVYVVGNGGGYGGNALVQKTQTRLYGMENDKMAIVGNAHDTAAEREATLQGKDLAMFSKIMCATDAELAEFEQKTLRDRYSVKADILMSNANRSSYMRRAYDIWMYADSSSSKILLDYAEKNMGVKKLTNYLDHTVVGRSIKASIYAIKDMGKAIVAPIRNTVQAIKNLHTIIHGRNVANFNELTESAQEFYYAESSRIKNYGDTDLYAQNELTTSGWALQNKGDKWGTDRASLHAKGIDDEDFSKIYIMLKAYSSSQKMLANYLEGQLKNKYKDNFSIKNFGNSHRKRTAIKDFFTAPKRVLSTIFGNKGSRTNADMDRNPFSEKAANPNLNGNDAASGTAGLKNYCGSLLWNSNVTGGINGGLSSHVFQVGDNSNLIVADSEGMDEKSKTKNKILKDDYKSTNAKALGIRKKIMNLAAVPTYIVNNEIDYLNEIKTDTKAISSSMNVLTTGLAAGGTFTGSGAGSFAGKLLFEGMAVGKGTETAKDAANAASSIVETSVKNKQDGVVGVYTGARITRFATGGTAAITGDAPGSNIFANGAKPELVQSTGNMTVTPLNKAGSSTKQKVSRMSLAERASALSTAISSHVVKLSYSLPSGVTDVSNPGEAIKVYDMKPGIADNIDAGNGGSVTLVGLVANIYSQLATIAGLAQTSGTVLNAIAANTSKLNGSGNTTGGNPFAGGFPSSLDSILAGE